MERVPPAFIAVRLPKLFHPFGCERPETREESGQAKRQTLVANINHQRDGDYLMKSIIKGAHLRSPNCLNPVPQTLKVSWKRLFHNCLLT